MEKGESFMSAQDGIRRNIEEVQGRAAMMAIANS
jgi:hypothetical protein